MSMILKDNNLIIESKSNRPMHEKRAWGEYTILDYSIEKDNKNSLTKKLIIEKGQHISYQLHNHRTEMWTIVKGEGQLVIDGTMKNVKYGDTAVIPVGTKHTIKAESELHIIEVQIGDELTEDDIERFSYNWC